MNVLNSANTQNPTQSLTMVRSYSQHSLHGIVCGWRACELRLPISRSLKYCCLFQASVLHFVYTLPNIISSKTAKGKRLYNSYSHKNVLTFWLACWPSACCQDFSSSKNKIIIDYWKYTIILSPPKEGAIHFHSLYFFPLHSQQDGSLCGSDSERGK